jgi:hypothetical protein
LCCITGRIHFSRYSSKRGLSRRGIILRLFEGSGVRSWTVWRVCRLSRWGCPFSGPGSVFGTFGCVTVYVFLYGQYVTTLSCLLVTITLLIDLEIVYWASWSYIIVYRCITLLHTAQQYTAAIFKAMFIGCNSQGPSRTIPFLATL